MAFLHKNIVSSKDLFKSALCMKHALGAFNFSSFETLSGIIQAANQEKSPFILQITESSIHYFGMETMLSLVKSFAEISEVPFVLHLDHGKSLEICKKCIDSGFSSVMIDKSDLPIEKNIEETKAVVEYASKFGVSVEAELGKLSGTEDHVSELHSLYTDPEEARIFVRGTNVDSLAVSIGTSHGPCKAVNMVPAVDIKRLYEIRQNIGDFPIVLHGASSVYKELVSNCNKFGANLRGTVGITDSDIKESIKGGVAKINVDTDLRLAFLSGLRESLSKNNTSIDIRSFFKFGTSEVKSIVSRKIRLFNLLD